MQFEWDEAKRLSNLEKHDIDFLRATQVFHVVRCTESSDRNNEQRWIATGYAQEALITVTYTLRDEKIRIISARKARESEKRKYRQLYDGGD